MAALNMQVAHSCELDVFQMLPLFLSSDMTGPFPVYPPKKCAVRAESRIGIPELLKQGVSSLPEFLDFTFLGRPFQC